MLLTDMVAKSKQLADRISEVIITGKWIANTNFKDQLSDVNVEQATEKIESFNTFSALTFHINYYVKWSFKCSPRW